MKRNTLIGTVLIAVCAVVGFLAMQGSTARQQSFKTVETSRDRGEIYGKLDQTSIRPLKGANLVRFALVEEGTGERMDVLYRNVQTALPANFPAASHAKATGVYDPADHVFVADAVLTKCPSKYKQDNMPLESRKAIEAWQQQTGQQPTSM